MDRVARCGGVSGRKTCIASPPTASRRQASPSRDGFPHQASLQRHRERLDAAAEACEAREHRSDTTSETGDKATRGESRGDRYCTAHAPVRVRGEAGDSVAVVHTKWLRPVKVLLAVCGVRAVTSAAQWQVEPAAKRDTSIRGWHRRERAALVLTRFGGIVSTHSPVAAPRRAHLLVARRVVVPVIHAE